nr:putative 1-acyl-sn-glycerol-3-phosphate acyltransferase [uncultured bacterium]
MKIGWLAEPLRHVCKPILRLLYRADVQGAQHVPVDGPAIIAANHQSFFDTPLLMLTAPRRVMFLGKAEYMDDWKTRYFFPAMGMVPIQRDLARASMAALTTAGNLLKDGELVGIYPEGTRSRDELLHRGHSGVAHLALTTGAPIVPVGLIGTREVQPIGQGIPNPTGRLRVRFGEPIWPDAYQSGGNRRRRSHMTEDVMASIAAMTDQARSDDFTSGEPPIIRGGSESVYAVHRFSTGAWGWADAASTIVADACRSYDDARIGAVSGMRCRMRADGAVRFEIDMAVSTRFRGEDIAPGTTNNNTSASGGQT